MKLEGEALAAATSLFKDMGLSQIGAQKLIDYHYKQLHDQQEAAYENWRTTRDGWRNEVKALPEISANPAQAKATMSKAIDAIAGPELGDKFRTAMDITGAGDHPAFVQVFMKIAQMFSEGKPTADGKPAPVTPPGAQPKSAAQALYPNLPSAAG